MSFQSYYFPSNMNNQNTFAAFGKLKTTVTYTHTYVNTRIHTHMQSKAQNMHINNKFPAPNHNSFINTQLKLP